MDMMAVVLLMLLLFFFVFSALFDGHDGSAVVDAAAVLFMVI